MLPPISLIRDPRIKLNSGEHLAIRFSQSYTPYMVLQECRCYFQKIWRPLCSLFFRHVCFLFFKFTLATGVFARAGVERNCYSKTSGSGVDICKETSEKIQKYFHGSLTIDYSARTGKARQIDGR